MQSVSHAVLLGVKIALVIFVRTDLNRDVLNDFESVAFESDALHWVVCEQTNLTNTEFAQNLSTNSIVTFVRVKAKMYVCIHSVKSFFLEFISSNLVHKTYASTFLVEILSNVDTPTVLIELADSTRAGVFKPVYDDKQSSTTLMLLMPMMINA